jgi:hypothetical protein
MLGYAAPVGWQRVRTDSLLERRGFEPTVRLQLSYDEQHEIPAILGPAFKIAPENKIL